MVGFLFTVKTSTSVTLLRLLAFLVVLGQFHSGDESCGTVLALDYHVVTSILMDFDILQRDLRLALPEGAALDETVSTRFGVRHHIVVIEDGFATHAVKAASEFETA